MAAEPAGSPPGQPAFPEENARVARPTPTPPPRRSPLRKERIQRRVREPVVPHTQGQRAGEPAQAPLPERLGRPRVPDTSAVAGRSSPAPSPVPGSEARVAEPPSFAPYGRLVKCELVFAVDSLALQSPIIALVMEDVAWDGEVIIPAGTEVFGHAVPNRVHRRIGDDGEWTFVIPESPEGARGREWIVRGHALDRAELEVNETGRGRAWRESDGAPGLHGHVIDEADRERIQLFVTTALAGAVQGLSAGLQDRVPAAGNAGRRGQEVVANTVRNAAIGAADEGLRDTLDLLARQILAEVEKHGAYVRVPAGKTFYLFVEQTLDPRQAEVGLRLPASNRK